MLQSAILPLLPHILDFLVGLVSLIIIWWKWKQPGLTPKDLLRKLEEKERENVRLQIELEGWKIHHKRLTSKKK